MIAGQTASGDIAPSRFVKKSGAYLVAQCTAADVPFGISQQGSLATPIPGASPLAATDGFPIAVYGEEENCLLDAGATVADGAFVKPDANGKGVTATTGNRYYAIAERGGDADEKMQVVVRFGIVP
ncbi:hypothetical protein [Aureliella helgolandensis]|uniref:Uncharacterized protein n=1 Tax=Aureliella helgolandensis TaxID=2527968 RepID=A0A518GCM2_9BACT|nr:hypothetical protein [Aureliella helgolandensis]QDV26346.1 hypothetical protein Q31a_47190 [Aureliella helgolandensis]